MAKILGILMAGVMVLGLPGMVMAQLASGQIPVTATVGQYAAVTGIDTITITFTGAANEVKSGSDDVTIERNCNVGVSVEVTQPLTGPGGATIDTTASVTPTSLQGPGISDVTVTVTGTLGAISAQPAGSYSAVVTLTVYAI